MFLTLLFSGGFVATQREFIQRWSTGWQSCCKAVSTSSESVLRMWWEPGTQAHHPNLSLPKIPLVSSPQQHTPRPTTTFQFVAFSVFTHYNDSLLSSVTVKPSPPINLQAIDFTKESVTLSWQPPTDTGRGKIFGYLLEFQKAGEEEWSKVRCLSNNHKI